MSEVQLSIGKILSEELTPDINQAQLPPHYPPLRALLSALSEELHQVIGSYCTRVIRPFQNGDNRLYVETTYGFPNEGTLYANGIKLKYDGVDGNTFLSVIHEDELVELGEGEVLTLVDPVDKSGLVPIAGSQMKLETATGSMLDVIGMNHAVPRYFDISDDQYRRLIEVLAYMAGKGTQDSIELFLDTILDHQTIAGQGFIQYDSTNDIYKLNALGNTPAFGNLLDTMFTRVEICFRRPNGELVFSTLKLAELTDIVAPDSEFYSGMTLEQKRSPEYESAKSLDPHFVEQNSNQLACIWRILPYRVWEDPYKREERDANVGRELFSPPNIQRQSVGNTVIVDLNLPQENSSIGAGYLAGKLVLYSDNPQGLQGDGRIRQVDSQLRLYLTGSAVGFSLNDGLRPYLRTYPRQVLSVRHVLRSASYASEQSPALADDALYIPVGTSIVQGINNWNEDTEGFYVVLNHLSNPNLNKIYLGQASEPIRYLQVDVGEVERPQAPHTPMFDPNGAGSVGVAGGVATAQLMPNVNITNPSFVPPSVIIPDSVFPNVNGRTLQVEVSSDSGIQYTQQLTFPQDVSFDDFTSELGNIDSTSPSYILDFFYSSGYQIDGVEILGYQVFSHAIVSDNQVRIYLADNIRSFVFVNNVQNNDVDNVYFGYTLPYADPDPLIPRRRIDYYPLYLGERNVLLLSLLGDVITVSGVIPEINTRSFQNYTALQQSWRSLIELITVRSI